MTDYSIQSVLSQYAVGSHEVQIEPLSSAGGWSGSLLWRLTDAASNQFCLRRWPTEHPTPERLEFIHSVLLHVARDLRIIAFPLRSNSGPTCIHHAGHLWELTVWLLGTADFLTNPTTARLRAAMHTLASFHKLAAAFQSSSGAAPAITDRLKQFELFQYGGLKAIEQAIVTPLDQQLDPRAAHMFVALQQRLNRQLPAVPIAADHLIHLQPAIRDIHHDHVLFTGDSVTGLIDFGAMRIDTPLTDIARLLGSLVADDTQARQIALDAYAEFRPLSVTDRHLIDWLDHTGTILAALNWLKWLYVERRDMGSATPVAQRLHEITARLGKQSA